MCAQFNKSVALSASDDFPSNAHCRTMNSVSMTGGYHGKVLDNVKAEVYAFLKEQDSRVSKVEGYDFLKEQNSAVSYPR